MDMIAGLANMRARNYSVQEVGCSIVLCNSPTAHEVVGYPWHTEALRRG